MFSGFESFFSSRFGVFVFLVVGVFRLTHFQFGIFLVGCYFFMSYLRLYRSLVAYVLLIGLLCAPIIVGMLRPRSREHVHRYSGVQYTPPSSPIICLSSPTFHSYTKDELLRYSNPTYSGRCADYLDPSVLGRILDYGIGKPPTITKRRGKRSGKFRDRSIKFKESKRRNVNISNVIYPECTGLPGRSPVKFTLALINLHSICAKIPMVLDHFVESNLDVCLVTETWIKESDDITRGKLNVGGIKFLDQSRLARGIGGGTGILFKSNIHVICKDKGEKDSFEFSVWSLRYKNSSVVIAVIYRIPYSSAHPVSVTRFLDEFEEFLVGLLSCDQSLIICGDFNIHVNKPHDTVAVRFSSIMDTFGLTQHVNFPTHVSGNTLDLIITRDLDNIRVLGVHDSDYASDHCFAHCQLELPTVPLHVKKVEFRRFSAIDWHSFESDLKASDLIAVPANDLGSLSSQYVSCLRSILDKHAPHLTKTITARPTVPWYNTDLKQLKAERRRYEKVWRRNKTPENRLRFTEARDAFKHSYSEASDAYYDNVVANCEGDGRKLYGVVKSLFGKNMDTSLSPHVDKSQLANEILQYFNSKVLKIRTALDGETTTFSFHSNADPPSASLEQFSEVSESYVSKLLQNCSSASCDLDPVPTKIVKSVSATLLPSITRLINLSITTGEFLESWKRAVVCPLLKKPTLPPELNNLRPVSNLQFISKLVEKVVANQVLQHCNRHCPLPVFQSAYRQHYSTETALLKIHSEIMQSIDKQNVVLMVLLDLSSAFDTVDHSILVNILEHDFGIKNTALNWFINYLGSRSQFVSLDGVYSDEIPVEHGVPQGSCLGPLCFTLYTASLFKVISTHLDTGFAYADDTQLIHSFKPRHTTTEVDAFNLMQNCISDIRDWMAAHKLKLNDSKTEFIILGTPVQLTKVVNRSIKVGDAFIASCDQVRNLGVIFDKHMKMDKHISKVCKTGFYYIFNLKKIRKHMSSKTMSTLVHSFIHSHLDYCNSLLYGISGYLIQRLQRLQNSAARLVVDCYDFNTPSLSIVHSLHWLPVEFRIKFKVLLLVYKCIHDMAPSYLSDDLSFQVNTRYTLRSSNTLTLTVPRTKLKTYGDRAFPSAGPKLWNGLPISVRGSPTLDQFKSCLKTHFFRLAFH